LPIGPFLSPSLFIYLPSESEGVLMNRSLEQDQPVQELSLRDIGDVLHFTVDESQYPGKAPKASVELFLECFLKGSHGCPPVVE
jgi:hypothetical protein